MTAAWVTESSAYNQGFQKVQRGCGEGCVKRMRMGRRCGEAVWMERRGRAEAVKAEPP